VPRLLLLFVLGAFIASAAYGQEAVRARPDFSDVEARFSRHAHEFENVTGGFFLFDRGGNERPSIDYALETARFGVMLNGPSGSGILRGNFEFLGEVFAGPIFYGPGNVAAGFTLLLRYNFIQPLAVVVPYVQLGAGLVYSDIEQGAASGNAVSLPVNFNLQFTGGLRFNLNARWSILAEAGYRHISNASIKSPNYGIDQLGGAFGFAVAF
jgi:lipid A 3-O-deacylase PagL